MNNYIKQWMIDHAHQYTSGTALAMAADERFCLQTPNWIWDLAQEIWDWEHFKTTLVKYD